MELLVGEVAVGRLREVLSEDLAQKNGVPTGSLGRAGLRSCKQSAPSAHDVLWWCHEGHRAVRVGDMKLVAVKQQPWELYDLATDRCETHDLAAVRPEQVTALEATWDRMADECRGMAATGLGP